MRKIENCILKKYETVKEILKESSGFEQSNCWKKRVRNGQEAVMMVVMLMMLMMELKDLAGKKGSFYILSSEEWVSKTGKRPLG